MRGEFYLRQRDILGALHPFIQLFAVVRMEEDIFGLELDVVSLDDVQDLLASLICGPHCLHAGHI